MKTRGNSVEMLPSLPEGVISRYVGIGRACPRLYLPLCREVDIKGR